jgi:hypothetical protein
MDKHTHAPLYAAIAVSTIISLAGTFMIVKMQKVEEVGGRENYKIYQRTLKNPKYVENVKQSLESQEKMLNGEQPTNNPEPAADPKATGSLTQDDITSLTKDAYIKGDK